jgi:hypothetical protein
MNDGAIFREALVEAIVDRYAPLSCDSEFRFRTFGAVREAVLAAAHEMAQTYPQLSERIQARFGMSGWTLQEDDNG